MSWLVDIDVIKEIIMAASTGIVAASALSSIRDYLSRRQKKGIKIGDKEIEVKNISEKEINLIIDEIIKRKKNPQVFMMYSHEEKELAKKITSDLSRDGIKIWLDENEIRVGDSIAGKINNALDESQWIIFIPPRTTGRKSSWVKKEIDSALKSEKWRDRHFIIPIKTKDGAIPEQLKDRMWVDFSNNYEQAINILRKGILRTSDTADTSRNEAVPH